MARKITLTSDELMAALLAAYELPLLLDDDVTPARLSANSNHKADYWRTILDRKVKAGELVKVATINPVTKHATTAYRPAPGA